MTTSEHAETAPGTTVDRDSAWRQLKSVYLYLGIDLASVLPIAVVAIGSGSVLLFADTLDYAKGIFSALISIAILRRVSRGRTGTFEHGVGRLSALGTLFMSAIINISLLCGIGLAVYRLVHPVSIDNHFTTVGAVLQLAGVGINFWLMKHNLKIARETRSQLMDATWRLAFADMIFSAGIFAAIGLTLAFSRYHWSLYIDPVCAIIALSIGVSSYAPLMKKILAELSDRSIAEHYHLAIMRGLAANFDLYSDFHGVKTRYLGGQPHVSIYLCFPDDISVAEALDRIRTIKASIAAELNDAEIELILASPDAAPQETGQPS